MKRAIIVLCASVAFMSVCEASSGKSYKTAREHLAMCEENNVTPPVGFLGAQVVQVYWESVPELKKLRETFIADDEAFNKELKKDDDYKEAYERYEKSSGSKQKKALRDLSKATDDAYARLGRKSSFKKALSKRQESLRACNIRTLEYIIDDYEKRGKPFPVDWIK